jgi:hypothetical protein
MTNYTIGFVGPVATRSGYGAHARDILTALIKLNEYKIQVISLPWGHTPMTALNEDTEINNTIKSLMVSSFTTQPDIFIQVSIPNEFQKIGKYNIGITAGIETTMCAANWIEGCNRMDLVLTTSVHSKRVFETMHFDKVDKTSQSVIGTIQLSTPVEILPEGSDLTTYFKIKDGLGNKNIADAMSVVKEDFAFLSVGQWLQGNVGSDRKDIGMLVYMFCEAFKDKIEKNRPALILKTSGATFSIIDRELCYKRIHEIRSKFGTRAPNVYLLHGDLTDEEMNFLYNHSKIKAFVTFTHGEGYGRPLQEFAFIGKPVIAPNWSGYVDFLSPEYHVLMPGDLVTVDPSAVNDWILADSQWYKVNYQYAVQTLKHVVDKYNDYYNRASRGVSRLKNTVSFECMQNKLKDILSTACSRIPSVVPIQLPKLRKI